MAAEIRLLQLLKKEDFEARASLAQQMSASCSLCPRMCHVDRRAGEKGFCEAGAAVKIDAAQAHFGEEPPLVGSHGSGTIFFTQCNLGCAFCQNHSISRSGEGTELTIEELSAVMLQLQARGCHNLNLVSPTHYMPQILEALGLAAKQGLAVPVVYNCGGYESLAALKILDGVIDIYMPDIKFFDGAAAARYLAAPDYPEAARAAVLEMQRQVGFLALDDQQLAVRGLLIRHLVMPGMVADSKAILDFIVSSLGRDSYVNVMAQYRPLHLAHKFPEINRPITMSEFDEATAYARQVGLVRGLE